MVAQNQLYVISTPIGQNLDLSPRAKSLLSDVDVIAAEDTRVFKTLANELGIKVKKVVSYHDHNERNSALGLIQLLKQGQSVALVSDAGTPGVSDPSHNILELCYKEGIRVVPVPGPSSVMAALSVCPIGGAAHSFFGFVPSKSGERKKFFKKLSTLEHRFVVFESPHRVVEHLQEALEIFGDSPLFIAREMTKKFEEFLFANISEHLAHFEEKPPKGEFVFIYAPVANETTDKDFDQWLDSQLREGLSHQDILKAAQSRTKMNRKTIYSKILALKKSNETKKK
ncbi:MAG: 16S rRNA (cytidine(1402)-2'-O)-methyltransferase [Bdellovibrionales bacterium]